MKAFPYIPDYLIESELGEGGMATVYMAIQQKLQRKVAIKILDPALLKQPNLADRFLIEAQTAANLSHPNIISIFDVGQVGKYYYIVMECLDGSLKDLINSSPSRKLPVKESLNIIRKIAPALDYAHGAGIIHRDIKPDNIMFRRDGTPVLVDFGIARAVDSNLHMTTTGMGVGTPHFMSPEQVQSGDLDGRSDFYSLGVVLYLILTGQKPFDADTVLAVALKQIREPVPKLPGPLSPYQPLMDKMMAKDKENRVQNGTELQKLIDEALLLQPQPQPTRAPKYTQSPEFDNPPPSDLDTQLTPTIQPAQPTQPPPDTGPESETLFSPDMESALKEKEEEEDPVSPVITTGDIPLSLDQKEKPRSHASESKLFALPGKRFSIPNKIAVPILVVFMAIIFVYFLLQGIRSGEGGTPGQQAKGPVPAVVTGQSQTAGVTREQPGPTEEESETAPDPEASETRVDSAIKKNRPRATAGSAVSPKPDAAKQPLPGDDETYKNALSRDTEEAYRQYLTDYPGGRHVDQAISKIERLKEGLTLKDLRKAKPKRTHHLRTGHKTLSYDEVESMIKRNGFFDESYNKSGNFRNLFEKQNINGNTVVLDHKTALMWHPGGSSKEVQYRKISKWLKDLNRRGYAGFSDWRLPTLEEAASLLRREKNSKGLYTDPIFSGTQKRIWTGDRFGSKDLWVVRFYTGIVYSSAGSDLHFIRPVRSTK